MTEKKRASKIFNSLELIYARNCILQNAKHYGEVDRMGKHAPCLEVYSCRADVKVHEENKCSKLHKYLHPHESVRRCVFHVVIDRKPFMAHFELLAGTLECPGGLSAFVQ